MKKEKKVFLWDWSQASNDGARFENLVASNLLKYCHYIEDTTGDEMRLCFVRDKEKREIDFVVLRENKPLFAVEVKSGEREISKHIKYFSERTKIPIFYQVHLGVKDYEHSAARCRVMPFVNFVREVLKI